MATDKSKPPGHQESTDGSVEDLFDELRGEAPVGAAGAFTLDREVTLDKMQQFQLADPHSYLLERRPV